MEDLILLKDWECDGETYKVGTILEVDSRTAKTLLDDGIAQKREAEAEQEDEKDKKHDPKAKPKGQDEGDYITKGDLGDLIGTVLDEKLTPILKEPVNGHKHITVKAPRSTEHPFWGFKSTGYFLQAVVDVGKQAGFDERLKAVQGMSEGTDSDGGFLVPPQMSREIFEIAHQEAPLFSRTRKLDVEGNNMTLPAVNETSRVDGSRWGGIRGYWVHEGDDLTKSKPTWREMLLKLRKLTVLAHATDELLADATALMGFLTRASGEEIAFMLDDAIIRGDGATNPEGILNAAATVSQAKEGSQTLETFVYENMIKMWTRLHPSSKRSSSLAWFINPNVMPQIMVMKLDVGTGGTAMWVPPRGAADPPMGTLMGKPIIEIEHAETLGTVGDVMLLDLSQYQMITKAGGIQTASSIHVYFATDQQSFRFIFRVDGQPLWNSALTPYKGGSGSTTSPFITLATRS